MPTPGRLAHNGMAVRLLRLMAAAAVIVALVAIVTIVRGGPADRSQALIAVSIIFGTGALLGMARVAWPYRQKDKHDNRS